MKWFFREVKFRQAISAAIDGRRFCPVGLPGCGAPPFWDQSRRVIIVGESSIPHHTFADKARALLKEAGFTWDHPGPTTGSPAFVGCPDAKSPSRVLIRPVFHDADRTQDGPRLDSDDPWETTRSARFSKSCRRSSLLNRSRSTQNERIRGLHFGAGLVFFFLTLIHGRF